MPGVFVSYRQDDARAYAGRLVDDLRERLPGVHVFQDMATTPLGHDYRQVIQRELASCVAVLVLIGPEWLTLKDKKGRPRLHDPEDVLRYEIATAIRQQTFVLPILVEDAPAPSATGLPDDLKPLAYRFAHELTDAHWRDDVTKLCVALEAIPGLRAQAAASGVAARSGHKQVGIALAVLGVIGFFVLVAGVIGVAWFTSLQQSAECAPPVDARGTWQGVNGPAGLIIEQSGQALVVTHTQGGLIAGRGAGMICGATLAVQLQSPQGMANLQALIVGDTIVNSTWNGTPLGTFQRVTPIGVAR